MLIETRPGGLGRKMLKLDIPPHRQGRYRLRDIIAGHQSRPILKWGHPSRLYRPRSRWYRVEQTQLVQVEERSSENGA